MDITNLPLPPSDPEMEKSVLGSAMFDEVSLEIVLSIVTETTFSNSDHQKIFRSIQTLTDEENPTDITSVVNHLRKSGILEEVGGPAYIASLTDFHTGKGSIEYNCRALEQLRMKRELGALALNTAKEAYSDTSDPFVIAETLDQSAQGIMSVGGAGDISMPQLMIEVKRRTDLGDQTKGMTGSTTGIKKLDHLYGGRQDGDLYIRGGRPGMGKTASDVSEALATALSGVPVAIYSLEMPSWQIGMRMISQIAELPLTKVLRGGMDQREWQQYHAAMGKIEKLPIYVRDDSSLCNFTVLKQKIRIDCRKHKIRKALVDNLSQIDLPGWSGNTNGMLEQITKNFKQTAKSLNIPIVLDVHLNRGVETRGGSKRPTLADLRNSGSIEQQADAVEMLYRPDEYNITEFEDGTSSIGLMEFMVLKHRNGKTDTIRARFIGEYTKVVDEEHTSFPSTMPRGEDFDDVRKPYAEDDDDELAF